MYVKIGKYILFSLFLLVSLSLVSVITAKSESPFRYIKSGDANVVVIIGQSNATGCSNVSYLKEKDEETYNYIAGGSLESIIAYSCEINNKSNNFVPVNFGMGASKNHFGPEVGIAKAFDNIECNENTYIIKWTYGGSDLFNQWFDGNGNRGGFYEGAIQFIISHLSFLVHNDVNIKTLSICWMQGETDSCNDEHTEHYLANTIKLINYLREDLAKYSDNILFVDACISSKTIWTNQNRINAAKEEASKILENVICMKTNGEDEASLDLYVDKEPVDNPDFAHYDSMSMVELGVGFGKNIIQFFNIK